jgi:ribosomal protein S18 acetylase RimI-like enzyme
VSVGEAKDESDQDLTVYEVTSESEVDEVVAALAGLIPQLSSSSPAPGREEVIEMVTGPATLLLVARDDKNVIVGSLTLAIFRIPTGIRALIEDVVVDGSARGKGAGAKLVNHALSRAVALGAKTVDLTSRPSREEANRLYVRLGFELRKTNVYRRALEVSE